jgi:hypothetical protein
METNVHLWSYLAEFFLERGIFQTKFVEKTQTHFMFSNFFLSFFRKSCRLWGNVEKYRRSEQATDDNMAYAHCMLDTYGYKHTLSEYVIVIAFLLRDWMY